MDGWKTIKDRNAPTTASPTFAWVFLQRTSPQMTYYADRIWINDAETHLCYEGKNFNTHVRKIRRQ